MSNSNKMLYHFEFPADGKCVYETKTTTRLLRISSLLNQVEQY